LYDPDKFQTIAVGKKTYVKEPVFNIESANIACDEIVTPLFICSIKTRLQFGVSKTPLQFGDSTPLHDSTPPFSTCHSYGVKVWSRRVEWNFGVIPKPSFNHILEYNKWLNKKYGWKL
jgi:hypothetical protein